MKTCRDYVNGSCVVNPGEIMEHIHRGCVMGSPL